MKKTFLMATQYPIGAMILAALFLSIDAVRAVTGPAAGDLKDEAVRLSKERARLISPLSSGIAGAHEDKPNTKGEYIYEAASAKPLLAGGFFELEKDKPVPGLTLAKIGCCRALHCEQPDVEGLYWKLGNIKPGRYWIAIQRSGVEPAIFLNGRIVQATRSSPFVQVAPGRYVAEAYVDLPLDLKPNDEIAVQCQNTRDPRIGALFLRRQAPSEEGFPLQTQLGGGKAYLYTAHCLAVDASFHGTDGRELPLTTIYWTSEQETGVPGQIEKGADGRPLVRVRLSNPLPVPVTVDYQCEVLSYYRKRVGGETERLTLQPHTAINRQVPFDIVADEPAYSADVKIAAVKPPKLDWPEGDRIAFFDGLRQSVAWPNPWKHSFLRRVVFTRPIESPRQIMELNGEWDMAYTTSLDAVYPIPAGLTFRKFRLPGSFHGPPERPTPDDRALYLRRTFTVPAESAGKSYRIAVSFIRDEGTVWVNGMKIGNVRGGNTPLVADATQAIKPGTNELVILVRDLTVLMNPDYVNPAKPFPNNLYQDVPGYVSAFRGPGIGAVELHAAPRVWADQLEALPSFSKKTLTARFSLLDQRDQPARVRVRTQILDGDKSVLLLDERELLLKTGIREPIALEKVWKNPRLWGPDDPHLYVLAVEIVDAATGAKLDLARERFGFRECRIDGPNIVFNGVPIRPKGCFEPRDEVPTMTRGTEGRPDYCDETGRMGFHFITGFHNSSSRYNLESDSYWGTGQTNAVQHLKQWINHPSIIAWDLSNEWLCFMDAYAPDPLLPGKRFKGVSDYVRAYDPTRWTLGNAEGDFMGLLDNHCYHYMDPSQGAERLLGHMPCLPDAQFWRPLDRHFKPGEGVPLSPMKTGTTLRSDRKPIINSEHLWKVGETMPPGLTEVCGESDLLGWAIDSASGPALWFWKMQVDGNRDLGVSPIHHYRLPGIHSRACLPRTFLMPDTAHHGFSGKPFVRLFTLFNDDLRPCRMELKVELVDATGAPVADNSQTVRMAPGKPYEGKIAFTLPKVAERSRFVFRTRLYGDGAFIVGEELDVDVWPDAPVRPGALSRTVYLFDPKGETGKALTTAGVTFAIMPELAAPAGAAEQALVVIGEDALDADNAGHCLKLVDFTAAGGRVLFLRQGVTPAGLPAATKLDPSRWASLCFNRLPLHPVLQGIEDWDLAFWAGDRVVATGAFIKPDRGSCMTLIDSGAAPLGMEHVHLMEQYRGRGVAVLCQLPVIEKQAVEPMARELLARLIRYAGGRESFANPVQSLQVLAGKAGAVCKRLDAAGVTYELAESNATFRADRPILAEAAMLRDAGEPVRESLAAALRAGAKLAVSCPEPADADWLSRLSGTPVRLTVQPFGNWHGRAKRQGYSRFTAGLSHQDFYWKRFDGAEQAGAQADNPELAIDAIQDFAVYADGARELVWPGTLVELKVGQGTLLIDQRRWMTDQAPLAKLASRNVSALVTGLGVAMAPAVPIRPLPKDLDYRPIDLTPLAGRSLRDEKSDDGEGGWSDQGAGADLRSFKTGKLNFQGIPFYVGPHPRSCIVLRNTNRPQPQKYPTEVIIPVGEAVEGFYVLHGCAYTGDNNPITAVEVQYEDGTRAEFRFIGSVNTKDWARGPQSGFPLEKDTFTSVAWTGSSTMWPVVSVFKTLWVNPKPEVKVKAVRYYKTPGWVSVHILMGLTAVLKMDVRALSPAEQAQVAALVAKGAEAVGRKDLAAAEKLFREALAMDPKNWDACRRLGDVLEQGGNEEALLDHYHAWVRHGAVSPHPFNRIGEILEKNGEPRGALEFYKRSLQVEWNQPPVIDAVRRLEARLSNQG
jgi:hypothetical protein